MKCADPKDQRYALYYKYLSLTERLAVVSRWAAQPGRTRRKNTFKRSKQGNKQHSKIAALLFSPTLAPPHFSPPSTLPQLLHLIPLFQEAEIEQMGLLWSAPLADTDVAAFVPWERAEPSIIIKDLGFPWQG